jgi:tyrosyl-tRNA synthetase
MNLDEQVALLMQGTEYGNEQTKQVMAMELKDRLQEGRPLRVYCGYDPTTSDLHLGHTITMRKLRQFQDLGHNVTFLIGTYTGLIGDPSDKDKVRPVLTPEQVEHNARTYAEQAFRILDRDKTRIRHNAEWLASLTFGDLIRLGSVFTLQQFLARSMLRQRWDRGDPYDAVAQETDIQVGGTDQLFNIIVAGRKLQEAFGQKPQVGIIMGILPGTDGVVKMSKSLGNHIPILASPEDMYGKVMSVPDEAMPQYHRLVTRWTPAQIAEMEGAVSSGQMHPMEAKKKLAWEIVDVFHGSEEPSVSKDSLSITPAPAVARASTGAPRVLISAADRAAEHFEQVFQQRRLPTDIPEFLLSEPMNILDVISGSGLAASASEARRLIDQGGIRLDGQRVESLEWMVEPVESVLQRGKRRFVRIVPEEQE